MGGLKPGATRGTGTFRAGYLALSLLAGLASIYRAADVAYRFSFRDEIQWSSGAWCLLLAWICRRAWAEDGRRRGGHA